MGTVTFDLQSLGSIHDLVNQELWPVQQLCNAIAARRRQFLAAGVGAASRVVIAHGGTPAFFADLFAVWSLGACAACINTSVTEGELANVVAFTEPVLVLREGHAGPGLEGEAEVTAIEVPAQSPALILFTSGTTGDPKGVVHTFASIRARIDHNQQYIARQNLARSLCVLPTHFGHGLIGNCLTPLCAGADLYLAPGGGVQRAAQLGEMLAQHQITFMSSVPSFWKMVLKLSPPPPRHSLLQVSVGSAPVAGELVRSIMRWSGTEDVRNMYGITETANWAAGSSAQDRAPEDGLVGQMWGGQAAVRLGSGEIATAGEGELLLKPAALMSGYYRRPDLTAEVVRDGWYHSGDIGSIDAGGIIRLTGRVKNEINRAGMKVSPEEVDLLLERHDKVLEACAFGVPDDIAGEIVAVVVRLEEGADAPAEALRDWCLQHIRRECVPERWFFMDEIPKTDRGKLNRDKVRAACLAGGAH